MSRSATHKLALALVWLTVASGAVVFTEPAPVDALTIGLVVLLPVVVQVMLWPADMPSMTLVLMNVSSFGSDSL